MNWCARQMGIPSHELSRISKREGILWNAQRTAHMAEIERAKIAAARADLASKLLADAVALRERIWEKYQVVVITKDGIETIELELPDSKAVADFTKSVDLLIKAHTNLMVLGDAMGADFTKSMLGQLQAALIKQAVKQDAEEDE